MRPRAGRMLVASLLVAPLMACTSGDDPREADRSSSPEASASATPQAAPDFAGLLEQHRQVDVDPGDEPTNEEAYAELFAEHQADLSTCSREADEAGGSCPMPSTMSEKLQERVNVQIVLDSSGSMADRARGGTKMEVARRVLGSFLDELPANADVSLRLFGHEGSGSGADKPRSCRSTTATAFDGPRSPALRRGLSEARPGGWTPLARALDASRRDFSRMDGEASNFVYVVSDGIETCGGDPVAAARRLAGAGVGVDVNVVGFDVDRSAAAQLRRVAAASGGSYTDATDAAQLDRAFQEYDWQAWTDWYNCIYGQALDTYNAQVSAAIDNRNCVVSKIIDERNAIVSEAIDRRNEVVSASIDERNAITEATFDMDDAEAAQEIRALAVERQEALNRRAIEIAEHVMATAVERQEELSEAAVNRGEEQLAAAFRERQRLIEKAEALRDRAGG